MKKNVSGQVIGAQMVSATDGSAFTGSVTVSVTGDAGTQAVGSVGAGACAHEGQGYHTYAPAQAETNYNLIAFTFIGTGAIPHTVQVFSSFPQTVDLQTLLTTIAGYLDTEIAAIKAKTDTLPAAPAAVGDIPVATAIADALMTRASSNWEATAPVKSLGTAVMKATHKVEDDAGTLKTYRSDGVTLHASQTVSVDAANGPIDSLTGAV